MPVLSVTVFLSVFPSYSFVNKSVFRHFFERFTFVQLLYTHLTILQQPFVQTFSTVPFQAKHLWMVYILQLGVVCEGPTFIFYTALKRTIFSFSFVTHRNDTIITSTRLRRYFSFFCHGKGCERRSPHRDHLKIISTEVILKYLKSFPCQKNGKEQARCRKYYCIVPNSSC